MLRLCFLTFVFFLVLMCVSYAHVGDGSHLHCTDCGNLAHSGDCPPDDNFWVGLGKTIVSEFIPGSSTADYTTSASNPHQSPSDNFHDFMVSVTVDPFVSLTQWTLDVTEKPFNRFAAWVVGSEWCTYCESLDGLLPGRVDCPDCDN